MSRRWRRYIGLTPTEASGETADWSHPSPTRGPRVAGKLPHAATGMPILDAQDDFRRARRAHIVARVPRWVGLGRRRPRAPRALGDAPEMARGTARLEVIPLRAIVGAVEPTSAFDARFRPASELARTRWERIALAHRKSLSLPPVAVLRRPDGYYVLDGRHRVSVALALGHHDIEAWVTHSGPVASRRHGTDTAG